MTNSDEEGLSCAYVCRSLWCADFHQTKKKSLNTALTAGHVKYV